MQIARVNVAIKRLIFPLIKNLATHTQGYSFT